MASNMIDPIQQFFDFIVERHNIWHRRFVQKLPRPWTDDAILRDKKFCNIYRELDRGSIFYIENVAKLEMELSDRIFRTVAYRYLNHDKVFAEVGIPTVASYDREAFGNSLRDFKKKHGFLFNTAYRIYAVRKKGADPIEYMLTTIDYAKEHSQEIAEKVSSAKTLEAVWLALQCIPRVGDFLSYEIVCDLVYENRIPFTANDFVNVGPGALWGLELMFGAPLSKGPKEYVYELKDIQSRYLPKDYIGRELNLRDIEHSLCEFRKYTNLTAGHSHGRRFEPITQRHV